MDELERLYRRVVQNIRAGFPELLTRTFEVSQLYQQIVPYRTNRRELDFDSNEDYELALMQLLAGLRGYLMGDPEMQKAMRHELASPNPDLAAFRVYATATVALAPDALRSLERHPVVQEPPRASTSSLSPAEQAALAGRATEAVDATGAGSALPAPSARLAAPAAAATGAAAAAAAQASPGPAAPTAASAAAPRPVAAAAPTAPTAPRQAPPGSVGAAAVPRSPWRPALAHAGRCGADTLDGGRAASRRAPMYPRRA
ncbi:MAG: hypothetical protein ACLGIK_03010, partial [Gemmatimonadota bacterium]